VDAGGYNEAGIVCPLCPENYVHFSSGSTESSDDHNWSQSIAFEGECCGHRWLCVFNEHKGAMLCTTERLEDRVEERTPPPILSLDARHERKSVPYAIRWFLIQQANYTCTYCGRRNYSSRVGPDNRPWHLDHAIPLARGGEDAPENLVLSCEMCNLRKHDQMPDAFKP
jgi:hypothetical protein